MWTSGVAAFLTDHGTLYLAMCVAYGLHAVLAINEKENEDQIHKAQRRRMTIALLLALSLCHGLLATVHIVGQVSGTSSSPAHVTTEEELHA